MLKVFTYKRDCCIFKLFLGIYLPLLWEKCSCSRNPIVLGFTRGHFTALVPIEPCPLSSSGVSNESNADTNQTTGVTFSPHASPPTSSRKHSPTPLDETSNYTQVPLTTVPLSTSLSETQLVSSTESSLASCGTTLPGAIAQQNAFVYLPLVDKQGVLLPIHFTTEKEVKYVLNSTLKNKDNHCEAIMLGYSSGTIFLNQIFLGIISL